MRLNPPIGVISVVILQKNFHRILKSFEVILMVILQINYHGILKYEAKPSK